MNVRKWATTVVAAITAAERSIAANMLVTAGRIRTIVARRTTTSLALALFVSVYDGRSLRALAGHRGAGADDSSAASSWRAP